MAVRLVRGGLQSFSPSQQARTTIRKGTTISGGSAGARRQSETDAKVQEAKRQAEIKKQAEAKRQANILKEKQTRAAQVKINTERLRIQRFKQKLKRQNAQTRTRTLRDQRTGDKIKQDVIVNRSGERVVTRTNLTTGQITTRTFQKEKGFRGIRESGGLTETKQKDQKIQEALDISRIVQPISPTKTVFQRVTDFFSQSRAGVEKSRERRIELREEFAQLSEKEKRSSSGKKIQNQLARLTLITEAGESAFFVKDISTLAVKGALTAAKEIKADPKNIVPITKGVVSGTLPVVRQVADGLLAEASETIELMHTSPNEGFVKVGFIWFSFKSIGAAGKGIKLTGRATKNTGKALGKLGVATTTTTVKIIKDTSKKLGVNFSLSKKVPLPKNINFKRLTRSTTGRDIKKLTNKIATDFEKTSAKKLNKIQKVKLRKQIRGQIELKIKQQQIRVTRTQKVVRGAKRITTIVKKGAKKGIGKVTTKITTAQKKLTSKGRKAIKEEKRLKQQRFINSIRDITSETTSRQIEGLTKRLAKKIEKNSLIKFDTALRFKLQRQIKEKINSIVNSKRRLKVPEIARKKTLKQRVLKNIKDSKRKLNNLILGKKPKIKKQKIVDLREINAKTTSEQKNILINKLAKRFERDSLLKFDTASRFKLQKEIRTKIDNIIKQKQKLKVPAIARKKTLKNEILASIKKSKTSLDDLILGKRPKFLKKLSKLEKVQIAKLRKVATKIESKVLLSKLKAGKKIRRTIKQFKPKKKKIVDFDVRDLRSQQSTANLNKLTNKIAKKVEENSLLKFDTALRFKLQKAIKKRLQISFKSKSIDRDKIIKFLQSKKATRTINKIKIVKDLPKKASIEFTVKPKFRIVEPKKIKTGTIKQISSGRQVLLQKTKQIKKSKTKLKQIKKQQQSTFQRLRSVEPKTKTAKLLKKRSILLTKFATAQKSAQDKLQGQFQQLQSAQDVLTGETSVSTSVFDKSRVALRLAVKQRSKEETKLLLKTRTKGVKEKIPKRAIFKRKKRIPKKIPREKPGFNVIAKPLKTLAGKKAKRGIRINKVPLTQTTADNLRNLIADTSLARTARTVPTKANAQTPKLKIPRGFAKRTNFKFRKFRKVKGKKVPLPRGKVIERSSKGMNFLLDTKSEKRGIGLRARLKQLSKPKRKISAAQRKILIKRLEKARLIKKKRTK